MTKFFVEGATRMYSDALIDAWIEAEENLGLKNSMFFYKNGTTTQWVDSEEAEEFHKFVKELSEDDIARVFKEYFEALEVKDKVGIFECLAVFNEIDEHPNIANDDIHRRLKRVRETTHEEIYKLK